MIGDLIMRNERIQIQDVTHSKVPILPHDAFMKIINAPKKKYDAKAARKKAAKALRKQGFLVF